MLVMLVMIAISVTVPKRLKLKERRNYIFLFAASRGKKKLYLHLQRDREIYGIFTLPIFSIPDGRDHVSLFHVYCVCVFECKKEKFKELGTCWPCMKCLANCFPSIDK